MSIVRFQRANYIVRDIEKSLEFYRDILGFRVEYIIDSEAESYSYPVFEIPRDREVGIVDADGNLVVIYWITRHPGKGE